MILAEKLRRTSGWAALAAATLGFTGLAGGLAGHDLFSRFRAGMPPASPTAELTLGLLGVALWLRRDRTWLTAGRIVVGLALALLVVGGLDRLLSLGLPVTMSGQAMVALACPAVALCVLHRTRPWSTWIANFIVSVSLAGLLTNAFVAAERTPSLRLPSELCAGLIILGVGLVLARPTDRHINLLFEKSSAGLLARRMFFSVAVVPPGLGFVLILMLNHGQLHLADGIVLLVGAIVLCTFAIAMFSIETAARLNRELVEAQLARERLNEQLLRQAAELQETVSKRTLQLSQANAELQTVAEANARLALAAQNTANGVIIADAEGRIEWANAAFTRTTGFTLEEARGRKPGQLLQGPETDRGTTAQLREAQRRGENITVEILNYTKSRQPFWQRVDLQAVRDAQGRITNYVANQTDITRQRSDQQRLQQLNERLELATRSAALGVWEWDGITQLLTWDDRTLEIYGLARADFRGTRDEWGARIHPDDRTRAVAEFQAAHDTGESYQAEFRVLRAHDGVVRHVQSRGVVQRGPGGRVLRLTGTTRDVTTERTVTQELETVNKRLRLALRSTQFGVWELDVRTGQRHTDLQVLSILGRPSSQPDLSAQEWTQLLHPEDAAPSSEQLRRALTGELPSYEDEFRIIRSDHAVRTVEAHGYLERDAAGQPLRLVGLLRDISEDKQLRFALETAEQRWQLALEGSNDSVWDWDLTTNQIYHDERWPRMLGYGVGELAQTVEAWKFLVHPEDLAANDAEIDAHLSGRTAFYQHELRLRTKDGRWRWILDRGKVVRRAPDGRPLRMTGTHSDITDRRQLEQRLQSSEELANEVSRLAQIGGWEIDLQSSQVTWTESARQIHEVDENFALSVDALWAFYPPEAVAALQTALQDSTPDNPSFDIEMPLQTGRGRRIWVRMLGHGAFRHDKAVSFRGAIQDITARHESEQSRRELEAQLFQAQKMETLGTLAGGIAHDFNNLLTGIIGYHELAADSLPEDHPARTCLTEARSASLRARELVEQILTFGRHNHHTEHATLDLPLVVEEARRFLRATIPANVSIELNYDQQLPPVLGDATQLHQVILNLGSNAAHAMRQHGGVLRINLTSTELSPELAMSLGTPPASCYVCISVSDTGHGMDEVTRRRIFDPFFTTKKTREGTGLGLAVVHGIVRAHRGAIDVQSTPGVGTEFHIYLPASGEEFVAEPVTIESVPHGGGEFVCVVDDEEVVGSCTKLVLESKGYRTLIFGSAEQCLAEMEGRPNGCAVLVTDQTMPGMQGTELATAMRRIIPDLPVVIMSGYFSKISPQALDALGQIELLAKPFTTDELALAVHRALHPPHRTG